MGNSDVGTNDLRVLRSMQRIQSDVLRTRKTFLELHSIWRVNRISNEKSNLPVVVALSTEERVTSTRLCHTTHHIKSSSKPAWQLWNTSLNTSMNTSTSATYTTTLRKQDSVSSINDSVKLQETTSAPKIQHSFSDSNIFLMSGALRYSLTWPASSKIPTRENVDSIVSISSCPELALESETVGSTTPPDPPHLGLLQEHPGLSLPANYCNRYSHNDDLCESVNSEVNYSTTTICDIPCPSTSLVSIPCPSTNLVSIPCLDTSVGIFNTPTTRDDLPYLDRCVLHDTRLNDNSETTTSYLPCLDSRRGTHEARKHETALQFKLHHRLRSDGRLNVDILSTICNKHKPQRIDSADSRVICRKVLRHQGEVITKSLKSSLLKCIHGCIKGRITKSNTSPTAISRLRLPWSHYTDFVSVLATTNGPMTLFEASLCAVADSAVVTIQRFWRGFCCQRKVNSIRSKVPYALIIQKQYRQRQQYWNTYYETLVINIMHHRKVAAVTIQAAYKASRARWSYKAERLTRVILNVRYQAAMTIQKCWLGFMTRTVLEEEHRKWVIKWQWDPITSSVEVMGDFSIQPWKERHIMKWCTIRNCFIITLHRLPGLYEVKFIVNGAFVCDGSEAVISDVAGHLNNLVRIEPSSGPSPLTQIRARLTKATKCRNSLMFIAAQETMQGDDLVSQFNDVNDMSSSIKSVKPIDVFSDSDSSPVDPTIETVVSQMSDVGGSKVTPIVQMSDVGRSKLMPVVPEATTESKFRVIGSHSNERLLGEISIGGSELTEIGLSTIPYDVDSPPISNGRIDVHRTVSPDKEIKQIDSNRDDLLTTQTTILPITIDLGNDFITVDNKQDSSLYETPKERLATRYGSIDSEPKKNGRQEKREYIRSACSVSPCSGCECCIKRSGGKIDNPVTISDYGVWRGYKGESSEHEKGHPSFEHYHLEYGGKQAWINNNSSMDLHSVLETEFDNTSNHRNVTSVCTYPTRETSFPMSDTSDYQRHALKSKSSSALPDISHSISKHSEWARIKHVKPLGSKTTQRRRPFESQQHDTENSGGRSPLHTTASDMTSQIRPNTKQKKNNIIQAEKAVSPSNSK